MRGIHTSRPLAALKHDREKVEAGFSEKISSTKAASPLPCAKGERKAMGFGQNRRAATHGLGTTVAENG
jgi:hypothetical protein